MASDEKRNGDRDWDRDIGRYRQAAISTLELLEIGSWDTSTNSSRQWSATERRPSRESARQCLGGSSVVGRSRTTDRRHSFDPLLACSVGSSIFPGGVGTGGSGFAERPHR
jgi:hypothetical protein